MKLRSLAAVLLGSVIYVISGCSGRQASLPQTATNTPTTSSAAEAKQPETETLRGRYEAFLAGHPNEQPAYSLMADFDGDATPEYGVVLETKDGIRLWYVTSVGPVEAPGNDKLKYMRLRAAVLTDRGGEKHLVLLGGYPPQNTVVRVYRFQKDHVDVLFDFMADWDVRVTSEGIEVVWKRYKAQGGYNLVGDTYVWDIQTETYRLSAP